MTTEQKIPLNKLVASTANVRRTGKTEGIEALAASIAAHGLRQNLNVLPSADGKRYEVVAGSRRLRALRLLAKNGTLDKDAPVSCLVLDAEDDPTEISLVENAQRVDMHPDDQFAAFHALVTDKQMPIEDVAARFGVTPALVARRLKLANVSPKLRALYRKGDLSLEQMMAFAISDDHAAQEQVFKDLAAFRRTPRDIRNALTGEAVPTTHRLAVFVGLDAYVAAGGAILRDLFDPEDGGYLTDYALLLRLAGDKLADAAAPVQAEGWKWVKAEAEPDHSIRYGYADALEPEDDETDDSWAEDTDGEEVPESFAPEVMAGAGAIIRIGHDGEIEVQRGLIHPDDMRHVATGAAPKPPKDASTLAASMVEELTAHRTAALRIELARNPKVALAATVHALAIPALYPYGEKGCLAIRAASENLERHAKVLSDSPAHQAMQDEGESWSRRLPEDASDLFAWCLAQTQDVLLDLLAFTAALTVDAVDAKGQGGDESTHADALAAALALDMTRHWTPSVEGFFGRLPKASLIHIVSEAKAPMSISISAVKKQEAARYVAKAMKGCAWLPAPLRMPSVPVVTKATVTVDVMEAAE